MTTPLFAADTTANEVNRSAVLSKNGRYRYRLDRWWKPESTDTGSTRMPFMMLNPSTADAYRDDPTIRRCIGFARREGACGITVVNIGAYRATDPQEWCSAPDPFGPRNTTEVMAAVETAGTVYLEAFRDAGVTVLCLGTTKDGSPRHPLYVRADQPLVPFGSGRNE